MASAAEQLAANINFSSLTKSEDLKNRLWFTLGALIVYRLGSYIPIPGIDTAEVAKFAAQNAGGILGWVNGMAGGALGRLAIFALNIMPYISASIIMQLMTTVSPRVRWPSSVSFFRPVSIVFCGSMKSNSITNGVTPQHSVS